ncbi:hypothetical protein [Halobaculum lipolyticum]|uniref:DUF1102 domain-containing protein n=1 Tax=Halobaculum lipolyticum TaxID=3032001 RepID=A0ABD5W6R1_9EURY|nr:hypothetical protein [Halobaculum sp. DT31]
MKRRTFLAGLGTAAAGTTTAVGTGAFTSVSADRRVSVAVADDSAALVGLEAPNELENGEYATDATEGEADTLSVHFDSDAAVGGAGVNANAVSRFDSVFRIVNRGTGFTRFGIDKTGLANPDRWEFYPYGDAVSAYPNWDEGYVGPGVGVGGTLPVGIRLDTTGGVDLTGGTIVVRAVNR